MNEEIKDPNLGSSEQYDLDSEDDFDTYKAIAEYYSEQFSVANRVVEGQRNELKDLRQHANFLAVENEQLKEDLKYAVEVNAEHLKSIRTLCESAVESKTKHTSLSEAMKRVK